MIVIVRKNIRYGGAELLIERIAKALGIKGKECIILCNSLSDIMEDRLKKNNIKFLIEKKWIGSDATKKLMNNSNNMFITTWSHDLLLFDMYRSLFGYRFKLKHYMITADDLCLGKSVPIFKNFFKKYYRNIIQKLHKDGCITYMDTECIKKTEEFYNIKLHDYNIVRLPYNVEKLDLTEIENRDQLRKERFTILSISRAEFPMKGYLVQLLQKFGDFYKEHKNSYLCLVTFGDGEKELKKILDDYNDEIKEHIIMYEKMKYEDLEKVWRNASVYVGLGTSILDASNKGICSIPVLQYSMQFKAKEIFYEIPEQISANLNVDQEGYEAIKKVYDMDSEKYKNVSILCHNALSDYYDVNKAVEALSIEHNKINNIIKWNIIDYFLEKMFLKYDDFRFRN